MEYILGWLALGVIGYCAAIWPFRKNMRKEDWYKWLQEAPIIVLFGPFAYIFGQPM